MNTDMRRKTVAQFNFPIIQLALIAKVGQAWGPGGPAGREDDAGGGTPSC